MEKLKKALPFLMISLVLLIAFNVLAFILADTYDGNFWCGYAFITVSWLFLLAVEVIAMYENNNQRGLLLNAPGVLITVCHLIVQTILGIALMAISFFSIKVGVCLEVFLLAVYLILMAALQIYKNKISE